MFTLMAMNTGNNNTFEEFSYNGNYIYLISMKFSVLFRLYSGLKILHEMLAIYLEKNCNNNNTVNIIKIFSINQI